MVTPVISNDIFFSEGEENGKRNEEKEGEEIGEEGEGKGKREGTEQGAYRERDFVFKLIVYNQRYSFWFTSFRTVN